MKTIVELRTGLFPDRATVTAALAEPPAGLEVRRFDLTRPDMDDAAWDEVAKAILGATIVITN